nr:Dyp-type peroxidase [Actinopolymorpha pittospori]
MGGAVGIGAGTAAGHALWPAQEVGATTTGSHGGDQLEEAARARLARARTRAVETPGRQGGIDTPPTAFSRTVAFDLLASDGGRPGAQARLGQLLRRWSEVITRIHVGGLAELPAGSPAYGLAPSSLTATVGIGPSAFDKAGIEPGRPTRLVEIPPFPGDALKPAWCGGDLVVVVGAEDPVACATAAQMLAKAGEEVARVRWSLDGFVRTVAAADSPGATPRNLMGHKDGTGNPKPGSSLFEATVFDRDPDTPAWMRGGSYLVVRRVRILLDSWFDLDRGERERVIGRRVEDGAPLGEKGEFTPVDLTLTDSRGRRAIPPNAHIRLSSPQNVDGSRIYRRSYNYDRGWDERGQRDAGLLFMAWQANPATGFIRIQRHLAEGGDALNRYIRHEGSAIFAVPPAPGAGFIAEELLT